MALRYLPLPGQSLQQPCAAGQPRGGWNERGAQIDNLLKHMQHATQCNVFFFVLVDLQTVKSQKQTMNYMSILYPPAECSSRVQVFFSTVSIVQSQTHIGVYTKLAPKTFFPLMPRKVE